ncbi:MAG: alginate lyase family protein [Rhodobiaceae bacterium]|nr:alginate lyase family protein [Rhodobiaceae bacterium]
MTTGNALSKAQWYANRLRAMSAGEIAHRFTELARKRRAGKRSFGWTYFADTPDILPRLPLPLERFRSAGNDLIGTWKAVASKSMSQGYRFLGVDWPEVSRDGKWHLDPGTGRNWPQDVYCFGIDYRHSDQLGDVKHVWELNRLQYLQPIAALHAATGEKALATFCLEEIESWIDANPPFDGINWTSGIELALRAISIMFVLGAIGEDNICDAMRAKISRCLAAHAYWLACYPSRFSSANNHLIAEAAALFLLGTLWPELPYAGDHERYGRETLVTELNKQILEDGVGAEQSPTYTCFTLEWLLLCLQTAEASGKPFPVSVDERLQAAAEHLRWITDQNGHQPRIGDDDEGRVICSQTKREEYYCSSVLACLCSHLQRPELAPPAIPLHLRNIVMGGAVGCGEGPKGWRAFDAGGYTIFRQDMAGRHTLLALDHGPLGYLSIAAHGHADALSVWMHADGEPVIVDAGTYLYHSGGPERDHFRGTQAHNTLCISGENQSRIAGPFNWSQKARAWRIPMSRTEGGLCAVACHDGYKRCFGLVHQRNVALAVPDGYTITDRLLGTPREGKTSAEIRYCISPHLSVRQVRENAVEISKKGVTLACMAFTNDNDGQPVSIQLEDIEVSPAFGALEAARCIVVRMSCDELCAAPLKTHLKISHPKPAAEIQDWDAST